MKQKHIIIILFFITLSQLLLAQQETYTVTLAPFSSNIYDEYSPVYYRHGIVFSSNRSPINVSTYSTSQNQSLFKIYYIDTTGIIKWQDAKLFSKELKTKLNDGPATFSLNGDTIYYSRNLEVEGKTEDLSSTRNKLGIFSAVLLGEKWSEIRSLRINNEWYNVTTPCLSSDGKKLFFASDEPGGQGGSDLYYCLWKNDYWDNPVNLGPVINTSGNEAYPFINADGDLFFSSDGHPGLGGKDIFFSHFADTAWIPPVPLDPPINSQFDDFGIITDTLMNEGYFSSDRNNTIDIYQFKTNFPQVFYSNIQKENKYCFMFSDSGAIKIDTLNLKYVWDFGDGINKSGEKASHCFTGPGKYNIKLDIIDRAAGDLFFTKLAYNLELKEYDQPYIESEEIAIKGNPVDFNGGKSHLPGYVILDYLWNFGDKTRTQGESVKHSFDENGEFLVNLILTIRSNSTGNLEKRISSKKVIVVDDFRQKELLMSATNPKTSLLNIRNYDNMKIDPGYSAEIEFKQDVEFHVEIISSNKKRNINDIIFSNVPKKYNVIEFQNQENGTFSYIIDRQMNLMDTYIAYKEIKGLGYTDTQIKTRVLKDPAEKELSNLMKLFGNSIDNYFDSNNRLTPNAYLLLDQIAKLMNKFPEIRIEAAVHTSSEGIPENQLSLSQRYVQTIIGYIIEKGIDKARLIGIGFGGTRPIAPNDLNNDKKKNRRVDFHIINES
jgi:outer membrane protein OmpA-like peptidoglycan-associated protein